MYNMSKFYTQKGYDLIRNQAKLSSSMEDYLEMISRMQQYNDFVRISQLAHNLNVKPSSASKMVNNLKSLGFVTLEKYGNIKLTNKGIVYGNYLLHRHEILNKFLTFINSSKNELEQVERIEHYFDERTIENIEKFLQKLDI